MVQLRMRRPKQIQAAFFRQPSGKEPVRDWLLELSSEDRKIIGDDIRTAEFGWPLGMPLCRQLRGRPGLWEIRNSLAGGRIARVFFCIDGDQMVLLHGIIKKSQKTPTKDLNVAEKRKKELS